MRLAQHHTAALLAILIVASPSFTRSQARIEVFQLAPESPLATDGALIFGVATDQRTILVSAGAGADWRVLTRRPSPQRITGLTWDRGVLYLSDEQTRAVYRLPMSSEPRWQLGGGVIPETQVELIQQGAFRRPRDLAFSRGLFVSDPEPGVVYRVDPFTKKTETFATVPLPGGLEVAADQRTLTMTATEAGEIHQTVAPPFPGYAVDFSVWRTRERREAPAGSFVSVVQRRFQPIQAPSAPAMANGSLYVIDKADGALYVSFRLQARAIPIAPFTPIRKPTRLLPVGDSLMVLDATRGLLDRWPLPIPTEFQLGADPEAALDALYQFLFERRVLPVRTVPWRTSLEDTLRSEGVINKTPGPGLLAALCGVNQNACAAASSSGRMSWTAQRQTILIPNLLIESQLDLESLNADDLGDATLGERVDAGITSPAFAASGNDEQLWELNESRLKALDTFQSRQPSKESWGPYTRERLRYLRRRNVPPGFELTIPVEKVRTFVALPRQLLDDQRLNAIRFRSPGFYWNRQEDTEAKAQSSQPPPDPGKPAPCDLKVIAEPHKVLRNTINFRAPSRVLTPVNVGVVEESDVDVLHPAFGPNFDALAFLPSRPAPAGPAPAPRAPMCGVTFLREQDHATAVASLITGREAGLEGLASHVRIVPMSGRDDVIGTQLTSAFRDRRVRIFNISLHYDHRLVTNLRLKINTMDALFVVAAGNDVTDSKPVCESATPYPAYPVCEGYRKNVLVVAATGIDGASLIQGSPNPPEPGSNWNQELVHIAAPGTGYYAAGRDNTYKEVRGTSFATPLVTATAALLYAQGVTQPWLIKQRIIATAEQNDNLIGKVYGAGLLNVERALHEPNHGVLWTSNASKVVELEPGNIAITWQAKAGGSRTLPLSHVRRLTRSGTGGSYRIVYYDEVSDSLIVQPDIEPAQWPIQYRLIDPNTGNPTGAIIDDELGNYRDYVGPIIF